MRFLKPFVFVCFAITAFLSCKKNSTTVDTTPYFYFFNGGSTNFDKGLILFSSEDTATYNLVISYTFLPSKPTTVTIDVDDSYRQSYNTANGTNYDVMPAQSYTFQKTFTATDSTIYDTIPVTFNKQFLNGGNYLLPIRITSVSNGYKIDSGADVIYLHTQAAVLSGRYTSTGKRVLYVGDSADNNIQSIDTFTINKNLVPGTDGKSTLDYANLGANGWQYILSFSQDDNSFLVQANTVMINSIQAGSFVVLSSSFDPSTKYIYIRSRYKNTNGDERIVEESLTLQ
jgi:hypothetical protein